MDVTVSKTSLTASILRLAKSWTCWGGRGCAAAREARRAHWSRGNAGALETSCERALSLRRTLSRAIYHHLMLFATPGSVEANTICL